MRPKRSCDVSSSEVACIYKLTKTKVTPISFTYPRKVRHTHTVHAANIDYPQA